MLTIHTTKAANEFFTKTKQGKKISPVEKAPYKKIDEIVHLSDSSTQSLNWLWFVHCIKINRKNVLIVMDNQNRFAMSFADIKKGDVTEFLKQFKQRLLLHSQNIIGHLNSLDLQHKIDATSYLTQLNKVIEQQQLFLLNDRSVQAHINDVAWHFEVDFKVKGRPINFEKLVQFDEAMNWMIKKRKGQKDYFEPNDAFLNYGLENFSNLNQLEKLQIFKDYKQKKREYYQSSHKQLVFDQRFGETIQQKAVVDQAQLPDNVISLQAFKDKKNEKT